MRSGRVITLCLLGANVFAALANSSAASSFPFLSNSRSFSDCNNGTSEEFPMEGSKCSATDSGQTHTLFRFCTKFLECSSDNVWTQANCPEGKFYTEVLQRCVPPEKADCAAALFGREAKILIEGSGKPLIETFGGLLNYSYWEAFVVTACQGCFSRTCPTNTPAVASKRLPGDIWLQTLVATRPSNTDFYSFAFDRIKHGEFNVLTEIVTNGRMEVWSKLYVRNPSPESNTWRVVPTKDSPLSGHYRIVSPRSQRALTLADRLIGDDQGGLHHALELRELEEYDKGQLWRFERVGEN